MSATPEACAHEVLEVVPLVMRTIRSDMRRYRGRELAVPHFRVLAFLSQNAGASLSDVAEHMGLRLPSLSTLVAGLVERGLVIRQTSAADRRRVALALSSRGQATLARARQATLKHLALRLNALSDQDRLQIIQGLAALRAVFTDPGPPGHAA